MLEHCRNSFIGIFTTLDRRFRLSFTDAEVSLLIDDINAAISIRK